MDNYKYVRVDNIFQRLGQRLKGIELPFDDIVEWCAECEINEIGQYQDWDINYDTHFTSTDITSRQVTLPTNCFYVKSCKSGITAGCRYLDFTVNGNYLTLEEDITDFYIDYIAFPVDSVTGYLLIPRGHENACFWYCMKALKLADYLDGRLDQNRWSTIENEYQIAVEKAWSSSARISDNDKVKVLDALRTTNYNYQDPTRRWTRNDS